ncbi:unnamed protein product [Phaedon cochleariae]|uniref:Solute carrier family 25 member 35-like n=1 Tax=Phaedon cochleariae TaxID=80249 RepID=A0A9N9SEY3_PHACE|nr:unnamed protein product [Phaedon cochleariae]
MEFLTGGVAAMGAVCFTNPLEVVKTRMQLQGELKARGEHAIHYRNVFHAGFSIVKNEGTFALQKGLAPALGTQLFLNGARLGIFQMAENRGYIKTKEGKVIFRNMVIFGAVGGCIGQFLSSPLYMMKTQLQAQAAKAVAVGFQHSHQGTWNAFRKIFNEYGIRGLYRGASASVPRTTVGSVFQLGSFEYMKQYLQTYDYFEDKPVLMSFLGSMAGGVAVSVSMTPFDLILTRTYNQPTDKYGKGKYYANYLDCVYKIYKTEGLSAFYKGLGPMYLRLGPHTVLCMVFWDKLKSFQSRFDSTV